MYIKNQTRFAIAVLVMATLTACGGGGGGGSTTQTSTPVNTTTQPTSTASTLVTSVPAATYAAGSEALGAYNLLNQERQRCGFGLLAQSTQLDQAAAAHANWLMVNNYSGHIESASVPNGYTGVDSAARAVAAGYTTLMAVGETVADVSGGNAVAGYAMTQTRALLSAPYHLAGMVDLFTQVGIGPLTSDQAGTTSTYGKRQIVVFNFGVPSPATAGQLLDGAAVATYPCQGTTGTAWELTNESPNPVPGRNLATQPIGQPVLVMVRSGNTLTLTSATITNIATGSPVPLLPFLTGSNDPNGNLSNNKGIVMPSAPLAPNTSYQVIVAGTNNGTPFSQTFIFTTGN